MPPEAAYNHDIVSTQHKALLKLSGILDASQDPKEIRLVAAAVARLKPIPVPAGPCPPDPAPRSTPSASPPPICPPVTRQQPLSKEELALLASILPEVNPARFLKKHTPGYWREVIHRNLSTPAPPWPATA